MEQTETKELIEKIERALEARGKSQEPVQPQPQQEQASVAEQGEFTFEDYVLPGLAYSPDGSITVASMLDLILVCLAVSGNPKVDEVLRNNQIVLKDKQGKVLFPRVQS